MAVQPIQIRQIIDTAIIEPWRRHSETGIASSVEPWQRWYLSNPPPPYVEQWARVRQSQANCEPWQRHTTAFLP